ncbi:hypothetical protein [Synechococcus sp. PCC 7335]|uniref:hypothetical protein n=1 Tax=Synechococcus sp. (strain ATCC 29403 / PCC 7335) TaxID=91464 RepID=UPI0012F76BAB|nr:hypothetical protein [Synechococcus sp. PCC 7335]
MRSVRVMPMVSKVASMRAIAPRLASDGKDYQCRYRVSHSQSCDLALRSLLLYFLTHIFFLSM